jgi:elongation factor Ts
VEIKAADVKKLRDKTGAGMMDCKKALTDAEGDFSKAERILKELGLAAAQKRADRATNEGRIFTAVTGNKGGILEISCETDFVARNAQFVELGKSLLTELIESKADLNSEQVQERIKDAISTIKENMAARRYEVMEAAENEFLVDYVHGDAGSIGVLVKIAVGDAGKADAEAVRAFGFDVALHIAAFNPVFLSEDTVDSAYLKEQEQIFTKQAEGLGKPEKVIPGIVKGKMKKHLAEVTLLNQPFVKDDKRSVSEVAGDLGKEQNTTIEVKDYVYYRVGEEAE